MNLPDLLKVGPHGYTVTTDPELMRSRDERGFSDTVLHKIVLAEGMCDPATAETLLHEALHAVWTSTALPATGAEEHQELVVTALAGPALALLRDNPSLVEYLVRADVGGANQ